MIIHLWNLEQPYLYTLYTDVYVGEKLVDTYSTNFGIRKIEFDPQKGFMLNGCPVKLKGTNLHQDHAGVGNWNPRPVVGVSHKEDENDRK